jgi:surface antigen
MQQIARVLFVLPAFALAACGTSPQVTNCGAPANTALTAPADATVLQAPAQTISTAAATTDVSAFVDPTAYGQLGTKSKAEVAGAQFNALQFGRVGAPRNWQGDKGQSGAITVGPYVRVNLIDCRDFTNTVTINGQAFSKKGTACREANGSWTVTATKTG